MTSRALRSRRQQRSRPVDRTTSRDWHAESPAAPAVRPSPWGLLAAVASQAIAVAAVLYYVGWIRAQETFSYFGVDVGIVGFSPTDYVLRSVPTVVPALVAIGAAAVAAIELHRRAVAPWLARSPAAHMAWVSRTLWAAAGILAAALVTLYAAYDRLGHQPRVALPLLLTAAAGCADYARMVSTPSHEDHAAGDVVFSLLAVLGVVGVVWALALYGVHEGQSLARRLHANLPSAPGITVYSAKLLAIPGVPFDEVGAGQPPDKKKQLQEASAYRYRYQGLRLLTRTPDGYLLLPAAWQKGDPVLLVRLDEGVRIDLGGPG